MKNITVTVDDETYRRARILAAERETSVSAMVKEYLESRQRVVQNRKAQPSLDHLNAVAGKETDFERRKRLEAQVRAGIRSFRASDRMSRYDIHRR